MASLFNHQNMCYNHSSISSYVSSLDQFRPQWSMIEFMPHFLVAQPWYAQESRHQDMGFQSLSLVAELHEKAHRGMYGETIYATTN